MALSPAARRAIAIRNNIKRKAANDGATANDNQSSTSGTMHKKLLAMCVEAGGFDQNAAYV